MAQGSKSISKRLPAFYAKRFDINTGKLEDIDVLGYIGVDNLQKERRNGHFKTREEVKEYLRKEFMYYFWSRSEYEVVVRPFVSCPKKEEEYKIDVWEQIKPNLDIITEAVIGAMGWQMK